MQDERSEAASAAVVNEDGGHGSGLAEATGTRWRPVLHVGLDVHARTIAVGLAKDPGGDPWSHGEVEHTDQQVRRLVNKLSRAHGVGVAGDGGEGPTMTFWYEAGPCGYGLWRQLRGMGHRCVVVAPSRIPVKPGRRVKTDRRDANDLARLGRVGELKAVWVPDEDHEAVRDLLRCRGDLRAAGRAARQQLGGFLLRHNRRYSCGKKAWTQAHAAWLGGLTFERPAQRQAFEAYLGRVTWIRDQMADLDRQVFEAVEGWSCEPTVRALMALRGVDLLTAATLMAELGDLTRFEKAAGLMNFVGLVPSEDSSGPKRRQGSMTLAGNGEARRVLTESAWAYRFNPRVGVRMSTRREGLPPSVIAIADKAQRRLCGLYRKLHTECRKPHCVVIGAVSRELCGFVWAIAKEVEDLGWKPAARATEGKASG